MPYRNRLRAGDVAHKRIGRRTDRVLDLERMRSVLVVVIVVLAFALVAQALGIETVPWP